MRIRRFAAIVPIVENKHFRLTYCTILKFVAACLVDREAIPIVKKHRKIAVFLIAAVVLSVPGLIPTLGQTQDFIVSTVDAVDERPETVHRLLTSAKSREGRIYALERIIEDPPSYAGWREQLRKHPDSLLILRLAPYLMQEFPDFEGRKTLDGSSQVLLAEMFLYTLAYYPNFTNETRKWAQRILTSPEDNYLQAAREFLATNHRIFEEIGEPDI